MKREQPTWKVQLVDALVLTSLIVVAASPLADVYSGPRWLAAAAGGAVLGAGLVEGARRLSFGPLLTSLLLAVGYLVAGPALAAPDDATAGVLPSIEAERTLVTGVVTSWRTVLTLPVPLGSDRGELLVPFLVALLAAALGATFLWRSSKPGLAVLPLLAAFVASAAFGVRDADVPLWRGIALTAVALVWMRWRAMRTMRASWGRRVALGLAMIALAGGTAAGAATALGALDDRDVARDHVEPPLEQLDLKSPLAGYREFYKDHKTDVLFSIDGLPAGEPRLSLASMDDFDGVVWNVTTGDKAAGTSAFKPAPASEAAGALRVTVGEYGGPWLPVVGLGQAATLEDDADPDAGRELLINPETGAVLEYGGVRAGDVYDIDWAPRPRREELPPTAEPDSEVVVPALDFGVIEPVDDLTQKWIAAAGATSAQERLDSIERGFQQGFFNDGDDPVKAGYSNAGHGVRRLLDLVADPNRMVGNDEQYASAMAYAAQRLGIPARVVLGFEGVGADGSVVGDDIAAWVEVPYAGFGWVVYDPTPPEDRTPPPLSDADNPAPQPNILQPPVLPEEPDELSGLPPAGAPGQLDKDRWELVLRILGYAWTALKVVLLLSPIWLVLLAKWRRRRRRRRAADPVVAVSGAWREVADLARDLGARIPRGHTRHEVGSLLAARLGDESPTGLAAVADMHVFGPGEPTKEDVDAYWADAMAAMKRIRRASPRWRRVLARLSPVSLPWRAYGDSLVRASRLLVRVTGIRWAIGAIGNLLDSTRGLARRRVRSAV